MNIKSFLVRPANIQFETQGRNEKIIILLRKHPITQVSWILFVLLLIALPIFGLPLIMELSILPEYATEGLILYLILFWYTGLFGFIFMQFLLWFFNVNIITNQRIIDIDFPFLLFKESTATRINQIEDITHKRGGFSRTVFDYGDVYVQTAGATPNIEFLDIPRPADVVRAIVDIWQKESPEKARTFLAEHEL